MPLQNQLLHINDGTTYTVTVGAGGGIRGQGSNSVFSTVTSLGGGRGGSEKVEALILLLEVLVGEKMVAMVEVLQVQELQVKVIREVLLPMMVVLGCCRRWGCFCYQGNNGGTGGGGNGGVDRLLL